MPWWGWLLVAVVGLVAFYYFIVLGLVVTVFHKISKRSDSLPPFRDPFNGKDPFDDPFFK